MVETHEYRGLWWLPADGDTQLPGTLTVAKGDAALELIGHFGHESIGNAGTFSMSLEARLRIIGMTTGGKAITLEGHVAASPTLNFPGIATSNYRPATALIGRAFSEDEIIEFDEVAVQASDLNAWTRLTGFKTRLGATDFDLHYEPPDDVVISLDDGDQARIAFHAPSEGLGPESESIKITQTATLYLRFAKRASLDAVFNKVGQLRNFLSLAVGRPVTVLSVVAFRDDYLRHGGATRAPVEILWRIPHNPDPPARRRHPTEMLFTLPEALPSISSVMRNWFARQTTLGPVFNLFFGMLYHPSMYRDVQFLAFAQAIETYDFRRRDPHELSPADHKSRIDPILAGAPDEWRDWLRMRLTSSNYLTLDQRIRSVLDECPKVSRRIAGATIKDRDTFVATFKQSRNYYTHYTPKLEKKAAKGAALYLLIVQLQAIIEMSLLKELGFECDAIDGILDRVQRYAEIEHFKLLALAEQEANKGGITPSTSTQFPV